MRSLSSVLAIPLSVALMLAGCSSTPDEPVTVGVALSGTLQGDDWIGSSTASLTSDLTVPETYLTVSLSYAGDKSDNMTPTLSATFDSSEGIVTCETARTYIWSSFDPEDTMQLTLFCEPFVFSDELSQVGPAALSGR